jgi:hypothetical protein
VVVHVTEDPSYDPLRLAVEDAFGYHGGEFLRLLGDHELPVSVVASWAELLAKSGRPLPALKFLALLEGRVDDRLLARAQIDAWRELRCHGPAQGLLPRVADADLDATVAREHVRGILHPAFPLEPGFDEISTVPG